MQTMHKDHFQALRCSRFLGERSSWSEQSWSSRSDGAWCKATGRAGLAAEQLLASHHVCTELVSLADIESYTLCSLCVAKILQCHTYFQCYLPSLFQSSSCFTNDINSCNGD